MHLISSHPEEKQVVANNSAAAPYHKLQRINDKCTYFLCPLLRGCQCYWLMKDQHAMNMRWNSDDSDSDAMIKDIGNSKTRQDWTGRRESEGRESIIKETRRTLL